MALTAAAATMLILIAALRYGGALNDDVLPGIPGPGPLTMWLLPGLRALANLLAVLTVGLSVTAAFLLPGDGRSVAAHGWLLLRRVTWLALGWAATSAALVVLTVSDLLGVPVAGLSRQAVFGFAFSVSQGQALVLQAGSAVLVAVLSRCGVSRGLAAVTAGLAAITLLPPMLTGHAAGAGNHHLAVTSLMVHVSAASLWMGGLAGLLLVRRQRRFADTAARYSRLALACFAATAISGAVNAAVRLGDWPAVWTSRYGSLVLVKVVALLAVGAIGAAHRSRTIPRLRSGAPWAFVRLAAGELVLLSATIGLAVALSRSPTPVPQAPAEPDPLVELLGFDMPAAPTVLGLLGNPLPDMFFLTVVVVGIVAYLAGVRRLRRAGAAWPAARTASWTAGMLVLAAMTGLGVARYAYVLFSVHVVQHMVLSLAVPALLVGGAPVTLALRALRRPGDPQVRGTREWLLVILDSRLLRLLSRPTVALGVYVVSLYGLYVSDRLGTLMRYDLGHLLMLVQFVLSGCLLVRVLVGVDPGRRRVHPAVLTVMHVLVMTAHALFGLVLLRSTRVIAADWYIAVHPAWAGPLIADQRLGASLAWASAVIPAAAIMVLLLWRWIRSDEAEGIRPARTADRVEDSGGDEAARCNGVAASRDQ